MKRWLLILILASFTTVVFSQRVERVSPQYSGNKAADLMIQHISEHLQIIVPPGNDISNLNTQMRCKVTVDFQGKIININITKHTVVWLELSIVDGLKSIPPSEDWNAEIAQELQKELVFSFGNWRKKKDEYGFDDEKIADNIQNKIDQQRMSDADNTQKQEKAWGKAVKEDLKVEMPLSPERGKNPNPEMHLQDISSPEKKQATKVDISLE